MIIKNPRRLALACVCLTAIATTPAVRAQQAGVRADVITNGPQDSPHRGTRTCTVAGQLTEATHVPAVAFLH